MSEAARTSMVTPEMIFHDFVQDPQGDSEISADAITFIASVNEDDLQAYQITGDRTTIVGQMTPAFRQDLDCAISLTDAARFARGIADADIDAADHATIVGDWKVGAAESSVRDLLMLRIALRNKPISDDPEADVASITRLIDCLDATAAVEHQPAWQSLQHRNQIMRANTLPYDTIDTIRTTLVGNLAAICRVEDDPEDNLEFWTGFVNEGADVLAEDRQNTVAERHVVAARALARQALAA